MRVLLINVNGTAGSTGKIVTDIKNSLTQQGHECVIAYGANETVEEDGYFRIISNNQRQINAAIARCTGILYGCYPFGGIKRLKRFIEFWKPDIVNLHCANGYILNLFRILDYLSKNSIKTVLTNHAEFYYTGGCGHAYDCNKWLSGCHGYCKEVKGILPLNPSEYIWKHFKASFDRFRQSDCFVTSVSPWVRERAEKSPALSRFKHSVVLNGLDTSLFQTTDVSEEVRKKLPLGKPIILHVTAQFTTNPTNKGGNWVAEIARRLPQVNIVIAATYLGEIDDLPDNIIIWGRTKTQRQLAELYTAADVTLICSYRETFSMVVAESLCCGTPVVGFKAGGPESIALEPYSKFVPYGNVDALVKAVTETLASRKDSESISAEGHQRYSKESMTEGYLKVYNEVLN